MLAWHLTYPNYFADALRVVCKKFDAIEVDRLQAKPKIKITGEFWLQTHEGDGNYNIKRWLEQEGCGSDAASSGRVAGLPAAYADLAVRRNARS